MNDDLYFQSRFWRWCVENEPFDHEQMHALREQALDALVASINAGEISSLDGIDSPLSKKIKTHHQLAVFEMNSNWIGSPQSWVCPCCSRSKFQVSRVGKKQQILAKLVIHHDHMGEALKAAFHAAFEGAGTDVQQIEGQRLVERMGGAFAAYEEVLVCEDCNNADTAAKKLSAAPPYFSFSIGQIRRFICSRDHQPHQMNETVVRQMWLEAQSAYELRMTLIRTVAHAAATDTHWYEPYSRGVDAVPVLGHGNRIGDSAIYKWISIDALYKILGPKKKPSERNLSRWRTTPQKLGRPLPHNFVAMLRSEEISAARWDATPEDWRCPVCKRSKHEVVYVGDKGKICFYLGTNPGRGQWALATTICNHCSSVLMSLKLEVSDLIGSTPHDSYGFVSPGELANIIVARPHSPHSILPTEAAALISSAVERLS